MFDILLVFFAVLGGAIALAVMMVRSRSGSFWRRYSTPISVVFGVTVAMFLQEYLASSFANAAQAPLGGYCPSPCDGNYILYEDGILAGNVASHVAAWMFIMGISFILVGFVPFLPEILWEVAASIREELRLLWKSPRATIARWIFP